jgi:hypothetical protein
MEASAAALTQSYQEFQHAALYKEPTYRVRGILTDGFDSTVKSMRTLFPGARLGNCLRHAITKLPGKLAAIASPVRKALRSQFHTLLYRARQRKGLRVFALGQRLRHFADHVAHTAGPANGERVRRWFQDKKAGWYVVLADPQIPVTSTLLDQAHNAIERKLFAMKGFHHPKGSQQAFLVGLAHLYNPWCRINVAPSMRGSVGWKWKEGNSRRVIGCSIFRSSPQEAFAERRHSPPRNPVECGKCRNPFS